MQAGPGKLNLHHSVLVNLVMLFYPCLLFSQKLIITELYRNPVGTESALCAGMSHEFIEITNIGTDTLFISNLFLSDGNEADSILPFDIQLVDHDSCISGQSFIAPGQIGLILDPDYQKAIEKQRCNLPVKNAPILFRSSDNELGNGLSDDDGILIYRGSRNHVDSIICLVSDSPFESESPVSGKITFSEPPNIEGRSIVAGSFLFDPQKYDYSVNSITPGWLERMQNGWIVEWKFGNYLPPQTKVACSLSCLCIGQNTHSGNYGWLLKKNRSVIEQGTLYIENKRAQLVFAMQVDSLDYGFLINNTEWIIDLSDILLPGSPLKINEIFPFGTQYETEWFELANTSSMSINLKNWKVGNLEDADVIIKSEYRVSPGAFVVIAKNKNLLLEAYPDIAPVIEPQNWHTLNNSGDTLCIFDVDGNIRDMVYYKSSWFKNMNRAIERVNSNSDGCDSTNWVLCSIGATPGYPNQANFWRNVSSAKMEIGPIPFTPDNNGKDDLLKISLSIPAYNSVKLCIFDFTGKNVRTFSGPLQKQYFWNGRADNGKAVQCGPFFVVAELTSPNGSTYLRKKGILWR
ncbi:MAG TPA: lamin tail domain-containing protein [Chitinispirillaceae bacterium]|nr:lamin tail domain-containing protein [Chitinispirillaceae bacterium]